jgi:hypothetical protein
LDYLDQDAAKIGCVTTRGRKKLLNQAVELRNDMRLILVLDRGEQAIDCGFPKPQKRDALEGASLASWFWPERYGVSDEAE